MKVTIYKEFWDFINLDMLDTLSNPQKTSELAVCVMEEGL